MEKLEQTFKINPLYETDGYKVGHHRMLAPGTTKLYGTWIPRNIKFLPKSITKVLSIGQQFVVRSLHSSFEENFFFNKETARYRESSEKSIMFKSSLNIYKTKAMMFIDDMSRYLGVEYDGKHFEDLWDLGYLPIKIKALPEGIETEPNIPHMTFINTVDGFAWLTLFLETHISKLAWRIATAATVAKEYRRVCTEWVTKTDPDNLWLVDWMCHDFHSRGGSTSDSVSVGLAHAFSFKGSDTLNTIEAARYYYDEEEVCIGSVNASEHSVSCTKIFTVGEQQMIADWLKLFPTGILSMVSDTFDLWKLITEYLPANKDAIMARDGKLVIRPDSGDPVDIICGRYQNKAAEKLAGMGDTSTFEKYQKAYDNQGEFKTEAEFKGVIELLWDIFGGTINEQGYKVLDSHIGAIYGDSINLERQTQMYERLAAKGFAATNIVLGVGSYQYIGSITRDSCGYAAKGSWFEVERMENAPEGIGGQGSGLYRKSYNIYKDPITDDGSKKSLRGLLKVDLCTQPKCSTEQYFVQQDCTPEEEAEGLLQVIYEDGEFYNQITLSEIRERLNK